MSYRYAINYKRHQHPQQMYDTFNEEGFQRLMAEAKIQFTDLVRAPLLCKWAAVGYKRLLTSQCWGDHTASGS